MHVLAGLIVPDRLFPRKEKKGMSSWEGDMVSDIWTSWREKMGTGDDHVSFYKLQNSNFFFKQLSF